MKNKTLVSLQKKNSSSRQNQGAAIFLIQIIGGLFYTP